MKRIITLAVVIAAAFSASGAQAASVATNVRNALVTAEHLPSIHATYLLGASGNQFSGAICSGSTYYYGPNFTLKQNLGSGHHEMDLYGLYAAGGTQIQVQHVSIAGTCDPSTFDRVGSI